MKSSPAWLRPKTTKLYLQPCLSERLALLCPDLKLLNLALLDNGTHVGQPGLGVLFLGGEDMVGFDQDDTAFSPVEGGLPIYTAHNRITAALSLEAFCDAARNPTVYFKVTLTNDTDAPVVEKLGLLPRSGKDTYLLNQHQEGYSPYRPNFKNWYLLKRTWRETAPLTAQSDMGSLTLCGGEGVTLRFVTDNPRGHSFEANDYFEITAPLAPGESVTVTGALRAGKTPEAREIPPFDYEAERQAAVAYWRSLTHAIRIRPDTHDPHAQAVFSHMAVTCLQMLARYEGSDLVTPRQGDVGRFIWPYEGAQVLMCLDRLGLREHTADAYRCYFTRWFTAEGEDRGKIKSNAGWDNFTGSVIWGLSEHLLAVDDPAELEEFLPYLVAMRDWISRRREAPREGGYPGIFPAGVGSDWSERGQFWTFTDAHNVRALTSMCAALAHYNSPELAATVALRDDYAATVIAIRDGLAAEHENDEAYILPHMLGIPFEDTENYSYYTDGAPYLLYTDFVEPGSRLHRQMETFFRSRGQFERGLTGRMTSCSSMWDEAYFGGYGDVWYTMQSETYWLRAWMATGETDKARETLEAMLTYGMTPELVVAERYCSVNPWYSPWQPNGSGSARMIEMLLAYFGETQAGEP